MPKLSHHNRVRLKGARQDSSRSQHDLAAEVGCTQAALNRIENGSLNPGDELLTRLCDALGLEWSEKPAVVTIKRKGKR